MDADQQTRDRNAETHDLYNDPPANALTRMQRKTAEVECPGRIS